MGENKTWESCLRTLSEMEAKALISGGLEKQQKERDKGKMTARERVLGLLGASGGSHLDL